MKQLLLSFSLLFFIFFSLESTAQNSSAELIAQLKDFHSVPKEVTYLHLNKSVFLQNESLGFSAYTVNKNDLKPSKSTTNLYVQIKNSEDKVVKEKLVLVENGFASNSFSIDSTFTSGDYTIIAFTNWMRNFDEQNFYAEKIKILESNLKDKLSNIEEISGIDAQFLPESGHLLSGVMNIMGVVVKDSLGFGLSGADVGIKTGDGTTLSEFQLNEFGIGKFSFIPDANETYRAIINHEGKNHSFDIDIKIEENGVILTAHQLKKRLRLQIKTNSKGIRGNKAFTLVVQNKSDLLHYEMVLDRNNTFPLLFNLDSLEAGMNIFTLFDEKKRPIVERLFFNYEGLDLRELQKSRITESQDSLKINLGVNQIPDSSRVSISILPVKTRSLNRNHNIVSYLNLQPYVKGVIENAGWYFENITPKKKNELDKLLITQGWSSYDWESIFKADKAMKYQFEENLSIKATTNTNKWKRTDTQYMIHASSYNAPMFLDIPEGKDSFIISGIKPTSEEKLYISRIKNGGNLIPAGLAVQFFPTRIPGFEPDLNIMNHKPLLAEDKITKTYPVILTDFENSIDQLDEVLIETTIDKEEERERKLSEHSFAKVDVLNDQDQLLYQTLANYLRAKGLFVSESPTSFEANSSIASMGKGATNVSDPTLSTNGSNTSGVGGGMSIYLDDIPLMDRAILYQYSLYNVDYIEINKTGMGGGFMDSRGSIRIYSDFSSDRMTNTGRTRIQEFDIPVAYAENKSFYKPKYQNEFDQFFQKYGIIEWISSITSVNGEDFVFSIKKPEVDFKMIIEGVSADGALIYGEESVIIEK